MIVKLEGDPFEALLSRMPERQMEAYIDLSSNFELTSLLDVIRLETAVRSHRS